MIGKIVKIDEDFLKILYPNYEVKSFVSFLDKGSNVIYNGKYFNNLKDYLSARTRNFISVSGPPELDLSSRDKLAEYVFDLKGRVYGETYQQFLEALDDTDFFYSLKMLVVTGKIPYVISEKTSMFNLYKSLTLSTNEMIKIYYELLNNYPFRVLESSFLTFLNRVANLDTDSVSPRYSLLIKQTHNKIANNMKSSVLTYVQSEQNEMDFLNLLINLRK